MTYTAAPLTLLSGTHLAVLDRVIAHALTTQRHTLEPSEVSDLIETKIEVEAEILRRRNAHTSSIHT